MAAKPPLSPKTTLSPEVFIPLFAEHDSSGSFLISWLKICQFSVLSKVNSTSTCYVTKKNKKNSSSRRLFDPI